MSVKTGDLVRVVGHMLSNKGKVGIVVFKTTYTTNECLCTVTLVPSLRTCYYLNNELETLVSL